MQDNQPYIMGKRRTVRHIRWGRIVFAICLLSLGVITFVIIAAQGKNYIRFKEQNFYYIQVAECDNSKDAAAKAVDIQSVGGSGYMMSSDKWRVMASVYRSQSDAAAVVSRLNTQGKTATVFTYKIPEIKMNSFEKKEDNNKIIKALQFPYVLFDELYETSVELDESKVSASLVYLYVKTLIMDLDKMVKTFSGEEYIAIVKMYENIKISLLKIEENKEMVLNVKLKLALCEIAAQTII